MLYTNLTHIETDSEYQKAIHENENAVIVCGSMSQMCIPVYRIAEELESECPHVKFFDIEFINPESHGIRNLPEVKEFRTVPFIVFYKNAEVIKAFSGIQDPQRLKGLLDAEYPVAIPITTL